MFQYPLDSGAVLKPLSPRDAEPLFTLIEANRASLREWLGWVDGTRAVEDTLTFIKHCQDNLANDRGLTAGVWVDDCLAGVVGFHAIDWRNKLVSVGYWLGAEFRGQGLMRQATHALVKYAFRDLGLNRVEIRCATENLKSQAIPEALGFRFEGIARESEWLYDHFVDHRIYAALKAEWLEG